MEVWDGVPAGSQLSQVTLLPAWAQHLSYANPILYMVNAFRYGFFGHSDVAVGLAFAIMIIAAVVMFGAAVHMLNRGTGIRE